MKRNWIVVVACILLGSCQATSEVNSRKGIVIDATMNTLTMLGGEDDTLSFSTVNADKTGLDGLLIGDSVEVFFAGKYMPGLEAAKLVSIAKVRKDERIRWFEEGIRTEAVDGSNHAVYVMFSADSLKAELHQPDKEGTEVLDRHTLPSGEPVWSVEDDDTKNLRYVQGCWTISQRGKLLFKQAQSDDNAQLGPWETLCYEGILPAADGPGIRYQLHIRHRTYSGDGSFLLQVTYLEAEDGKDVTFIYMGRRNTLRGIPSDNDATVWQLIPDGEKVVYNFLCGKDGQTLTLLRNDFEKIESELNYTIQKVNP